MRAYWGAVVAIALGGAATETNAAGFGCPPTVLDKGAVVTPGGVEPPWARHELHNVTFFSGDPALRATLSPREELKTDRLVQVWSFDRGTSVTAICVYRGTKARVSAPLPPGLSRCTLVTLKEGAVPPELRCE